MGAFFFYGWHCVLSASMVVEFERYGLARFRILTGSLEVAGALGLLVGYFYPPMTLAASLGLSVLMLLGVATRIRIGDSLVQMLPAFLLMVVNGYVFFAALKRTGA